MQVWWRELGLWIHARTGADLCSAVISMQCWLYKELKKRHFSEPPTKFWRESGLNCIPVSRTWEAAHITVSYRHRLIEEDYRHSQIIALSWQALLRRTVESFLLLHLLCLSSSLTLFFSLTPSLSWSFITNLTKGVWVFLSSTLSLSIAHSFILSLFPCSLLANYEFCCVEGSQRIILIIIIHTQFLDRVPFTQCSHCLWDAFPCLHCVSVPYQKTQD